MVRSDNPTHPTGRNMPYLFGGYYDSEGSVENLVEDSNALFDNESILILQAMEKNNINRNLLSANIKFKNDYLGFYHSIEGETDISTYINRLSLPRFKKEYGKGLKITNSDAQYFKKLLLYRVGWWESSHNEDLPYIDELERDEIVNYEYIIQKGIKALTQYPNRYPGPAYWYQQLLNSNTTMEMPHELGTALTKEFKKISRVIRKGLIPFNCGILKLSFLKNGSGHIYPIYLEILEPS